MKFSHLVGAASRSYPRIGSALKIRDFLLRSDRKITPVAQISFLGLGGIFGNR